MNVDGIFTAIEIILLLPSECDGLYPWQGLLANV